MSTTESEIVTGIDQSAGNFSYDVKYALGCHLVHTAFAAARMTSRTKSGWESMATWLLSTS